MGRSPSNTVVTLAAIIAALVVPAVAAWPDPPWRTSSVAVVATAIAVPLVTYPFSKTVWVALELGMSPADLSSGS